MLNGFIALEALFDGRTLQKDKVSKRLSVSIVTAELIIEIRNKLYHNGLSIKAALDFLLEEKLTHPKSKITPLLQALVHKENASWITYSSFADLMYTHFAESVGIESAGIKRWSDVNHRSDNWFQKVERRK